MADAVRPDRGHGPHEAAAQGAAGHARTFEAHVSMIGSTLSHYEILAEIGRGGMGVVYRARDRKLEREVALKVLSPDLTEDPEFRQRLIREAQAAAGLAHPNITVIYGIDEAEGVTFIAMELIRGQPLAEVLRGRRPELARALEMATEIAEALAEGHAHAVIHRDLKPGNVMITDSGHAKIIDFGLAKQVRARPAIDSGIDTPARLETDPGRIVGTAAYMAPEQVRGREVDERTDVFSFGALFYEVLTATPAFLREGGVETLHAVLKDPIPRLPDLHVGELGQELQRILDKCLQKDPDDRYQGMRDVVVDLRAARRRLEAGPEPAPSALSARPARSGLGVVIVDDEEPARAILREYLSGETGVELLAECRNGFEAVKAVADLRPDLVFLDIQMPKLDGFEVVELIGKDVPVVFVTAFDQHAIHAFEVNAVDYLLKPVGADRFKAALDRARRRFPSTPPTPISQLISAVRPESRPLERILVRQGARVDVVPVDRLDYAEAQDDYVSLKVAGKELLKQQTLGDLAQSLDPSQFVRIHRSFLLNLDRLSRLDSDDRDNRVAVLSDGTRLPVSRSGYARLKELL
jgi:two-component system LytT family response regulator